MSNRIIVIHDGAMDELMSLVLLQSMPQLTVEYIGVINGDCIAYTTAQLSYKVMQLCGSSLSNIYLSDARAVNAFPWSYREDCLCANLLPIVNQYQSNPSSINPGTINDLLAYMINNIGNTPFTLLCLGPLTDAAYLISNLGNAAAYIDRIVWTGGDISLVPGQLPPVNIDTGMSPGANPNAEWNVYWDPFAVASVFASGIPLYMFPTLVTDQVPLTQAMMFEYFIPGAAQYRSIDLAAQLYAIAGYESGYHFWNTCTTAFLGEPTLFGFETLNLYVDVSRDPTKQGTMWTLDSGGYAINVATTVDSVGFFNYYLAQLKSLG